MSEKRDFYEVLAVARDASEDDIRKAYRKLALQHHPDRNPGDASAEAKFKEATEAYSILSDKDKRAAFDRFGHAGISGQGFDFSNAGVGDIFSHFQDIFADFFGGSGGSPFGQGSRRGRQPQRGQDVRVSAAISLAEAMTGTKQEVTCSGSAPCNTCQGSGAKQGTRRETCQQCRGTGQVTTQRGFMMFSSPCPICQGAGTFVQNPCADCRGRGSVQETRSVVVAFPAGIDAGQRLRVPGKGMAGPNGTPPGDLYVDIELKPHTEFERDDADLITKRSISFSGAALGTKLKIEMPDGSQESVEVPAGTQPSSVISIRNKGMPVLNSNRRGHLHIVAEVAVPKKLSRRAKQLLEELESELR